MQVNRIRNATRGAALAAAMAIGALGLSAPAGAQTASSEQTVGVTSTTYPTYNTILFHQTDTPYSLVYVGQSPTTVLSNPQTIVADANILNLKNGIYYFEISPSSNPNFNVEWGTSGGVIAMGSTYNRGLEVNVVGHGSMTLTWLPKYPVLRPLDLSLKNAGRQ